MPARRPKVLIVDDEDNIVLALYRVLYQDNDRYDVLLARSAEIAQQILEDGKVDVLVTDVHLPATSGMDLLSFVAKEAPSTRVIVMTAFDVSGIKDRAHAFGCLQLVRKPFDVHAMRAAIVRALALRDSFSGSLAELSCVDVLQMLCIARKSTALRLSMGTSAGVVHIDAGEPVHAVWDDLAGEEAFFRILGVKSGLFFTAPLPPDGERSLRGDWQHLMIDGLRRLDEHAAGELAAPTAPDHPVATERAPDPRPEDVTRLVDEGFNALRAGRREDARRAWEAARSLAPDNRMLELNLRKLGLAAQPERAHERS
jgi:CheY-like chemotaxis protein